MNFLARKLSDIYKDGSAMGHIFGINLRPLNDEEDLRSYIESIKRLRDVDYNKIYIEEELPFECKKEIADSLEVRLADGNNLFKENLPYLIAGIIKYIKRDIKKNEVLLMCNTKDEALELISAIADFFSFISVWGLNQGDGEALHEEVLTDIGISIYLPQQDNFSLKKYGFIINTLNHLPLNIIDVKSSSVIVDLSRDKPLRKQNNLVIEDLYFDISPFELDSNGWIGGHVSSALYACIYGDKPNNFSLVSSNGKIESLENILHQGLKLKGFF